MTSDSIGRDDKPAAPQDAPRRVQGIDVVRGAALVAMIVYHFAWNLSFLGLSGADIRDSAGWTWFARGIAATFLVLSGIGLVLAHRRGFDRAAFLRRLALIAGAALAVTGATFIVFPQSFIFFGILHAIAAGSVLALPFLRLPAWLTAITAAGVIALPSLVRFDALAAPWLAWLGLGTREVFANDFVPVFPWFGMVLIGVALGKTWVTRAPAFLASGAPATASAPARLLAAAGRRSLVVYLVHQPVLFGALWLLAAALQPQPAADARSFLSACQSNCRDSGAEASLCTRACTCVVDTLRTEGLWAAARAETLDPALKDRIDGVSRRCVEAATATPRP